MLALILYKSAPWKQPIWKNKFLSGIILLNAVLIVGVSFLTGSLSWLGVQKMGNVEMLVIWGIMLTTCLACYGYNLVLEKVCFRSRNVDRPEFTTISSLHEI